MMICIKLTMPRLCFLPIISQKPSGVSDTVSQFVRFGKSAIFKCIKGQYPLTLWQTRNGTTSPIDGLDSCLLDGAIVKVAVAETERLLLLLTENGTLSIWDAEWCV